jgi:Zn-dependent membrane protease YugP
VILPFGASGWYWALLILSLIIGGATQAWVNSTFRRYSHTPPSSGETGAQAARRILDANGLRDVTINRIQGTLTDNYDPRTKVLSLSQAVHDGASVSAVGVAAHESGHALQDQAGYAFARFRSALVPVANFGSRAWIVLLFMGIFLRIPGLLWIAVIAFGLSVLFQLVTLPVEFDASRRALVELEEHRVVNEVQQAEARSVLTAAAMTYLAAALISVLYLLYYAGLARRS